MKYLKKFLLSFGALFLSLSFVECSLIMNKKYHFFYRNNIRDNSVLEMAREEKNEESKATTYRKLETNNLFHQFKFQSPFSSWKSGVTEQGELDPDIKALNEPEGNFFKPKAKVRQVVRLRNGSTIFDATYTFDSAGLRSVLQEHKSSKAFVVMLGCSFTFGDGLMDDQTTPHLMSIKDPAHNYLNYSRPGWGPNDILFDIDNWPHKYVKKGMAVDWVIYNGISPHLSRVTCNLSDCIRRAKKGFVARIDSPKYLLSENKLIHQGRFRDNEPWNWTMLPYLAELEWIKI